MASIDNRVVEMKFDNEAFQTKIASTISSLDKLGSTLKLTEATNGLSRIGTEGAKLSALSSIGSTVETIADKFNYLRVVAITTLSNIVNKAVDTGISLIKSLTITPINAGFKEYELNMRSIQTILANTKDVSLVQVKEALDQLNIYSDKTIYNFGQMAKNIGTFTAAGVDLDTSVSSIKGIANLAAISGASAEQASGAMYQLSQAVASGTVKLIDWKSVINASMGGKVFKESLYETGKALGTLKNIPLGQTFDQWEAKGNKFSRTLETGWVTSEVLTTTLKGFTGELNEAQIVALGYTKDQAKAVMQLGKDGVAAATEVRTFTQLLSTSRESVGSGWSATFRTIIGDFESATILFTNLSTAFSGMIGKSAGARNALLKDWSDMGGRTQLISALTSVAKSLITILNTVKQSFQTVFPPMTAEKLVRLTWAFNDFAKKLIPSEKTLNILRSVFRGVFSVISIGVTIVKSIASSFITLFKALSKSSGVSNTLTTIKSLTDGLYALKVFLVDGNRIATFFDNITQSILRFAKDPVAELKHLQEVAGQVFTTLLTTIASLDFLPSGLSDWLFSLRDKFVSAMGIITGVTSRVDQHFDAFKDGLVELKEFFQPVIDAFTKFSDYISNWFKELSGKMSSAAEPGDFSKVLDAVNVGIIASIGGMLAFLTGGGLDFSRFFRGFHIALKEMGNVLQGMQMQLKADAIMKIAVAVAVLAAALLVLSTVDSAALSRALAATAVGMAQLLVSFNLMTKMSGPKGAATFTMASTGMIAMSAAILLLAFAVKVFSTMNASELTRGLIGVTVVMGALVAASRLLKGNVKGLIRAGIALIPLAIGLNILAVAMMLFAKMSLKDIAKGVIAISAALVGIAFSLKLMPWNSLSKSVGLIIVAQSLIILAGAVKLFSMMSLQELATGIGAIAIALTLIALAMNLMPVTLPFLALGLLGISVALLVIVKAIEGLAGLSWTELAKGLTGIAGALLILVVAANAMTGALVGAIAMVVMAKALDTIVDILEKVSKLSWSDILKGLIALAATFAVIAIAATLVAPALGPMLGLAAALLLIGVAIALFGIGVNLLARGFQQLINLITVNFDWIIDFVIKICKAIPEIVKVLVVVIIEILDILLEALPIILEQLIIIIGQIIDAMIELTPKFVELIKALIDGIISIVEEKGPAIIEAGLNLLINFINGISNNAADFVEAIVNLITKFLDAVSERLPLILASAVALFREFVAGLVLYISEVADAVGDLIVAFITELGVQTQRIIDAGVELLTDFLSGIANNIIKVSESVTLVITTFIDEVFKGATKIAKAGADTLAAFLKGISDNISTITWAAVGVVTKFLSEVGNQSVAILDAGVDMILTFLRGVADNAAELAVGAVNTVMTFLREVDKAIDDNVDEFKALGWNIAKNIIDGATLGLAGKAGGFFDSMKGLASGGLSIFKSVWSIFSPSKVAKGLGSNIVEGLAIGLSNSKLSDNASASLAKNTRDKFINTLTSLSDSLSMTQDFNPTITPVIDLTNVKMGVKQVQDLMSISSEMGATIAFKQAQNIASTETSVDDQIAPVSNTQEVKFEQNIYSPTELSVSDIYRQTKNQLNIAKEELNIP